MYAFGALLNQGRFTAADFAVDRLNHPDPISNWRTNIGGSVPVFMGGRTLLGYQQAQIGREAAERGRACVEQEMIFGVVRAYYGVLLAEEAQITAAAVLVGAFVILFDPIFQGLAISLMAGEVASTLLSRMAVPVLYYVSERRERGKIQPA